MNPLLVRLGLQSREFTQSWKKVADGLEQSRKQTKELSQSFTQLSNSINSSASEANKDIKNIKKNTANLSRSLGNLKRIAKGAFVAWGVYQVSSGIRNMVANVADAIVVMDRMQRSMSAVMGSSAMSANTLKFLRKESERLGLVFKDQIKGFQQLYAAAKGTAISYQQVRDIFTSVATASTALQLEAEQNKLALYALQQMISKGVVTMEELRRQLGDQLPGAFRTAAKAMGVTTAELIDLVKTGELLAEEFVPKLADALLEQWGEAAEKAADSIFANMNRIKNSFYSLEIWQYSFSKLVKTKVF